ncbi:MAG: type I 3-dehydroquinate dehydratase [Verrucomicrobiota bacterium]|nr:type I 3-dehydroquinate dehydratase [Verrucomicrobiota bacterium]
MIARSRKVINLLSAQPLIVGTVHSVSGFRAAHRRAKNKVDLIEARVDAFEENTDPLPALLASEIPVIITIRHHREGGLRKLSEKERAALFMHLLPAATAIDIELRSVRALGGVIAAAREKNVAVIGSHHDFQSTPSLPRLKALATAARNARCDILKVAALTKSAADLARLLEFLDAEKRMPLSLMGMGPVGKVSRLVLGLAGSVLNYGYLDREQVTGQWPAVELRKRLAEIGAAPPKRDR